MQEKEVEIFDPKDLDDWRNWLEINHLSESAVWLVFYKKNSEKHRITWSESVDVALCFGWIDSKKIAVDNERSHQFFSKRKAKSKWSKINKEKVKKLIETGLMTPAGYQSIEVAKQNGSWTTLDQVEELVIPNDLVLEFKDKPDAKDFFLSLSKSTRKAILQWLVMARRPETRQKRIKEVVHRALQSEKPRHLQ